MLSHFTWLKTVSTFSYLCQISLVQLPVFIFLHKWISKWNYTQKNKKWLNLPVKYSVFCAYANQNNLNLFFSIWVFHKLKEMSVFLDWKLNARFWVLLLLLLQAKLQVGDVVKCCITKITYFGVFVEVNLRLFLLLFHRNKLYTLR